MDALSRLLSLHPVQTALDTRCRAGVPWTQDNAVQSYGVAPYHLIVEGRAWLAIAGREPLQLLAGDLLMLPRGHAHQLYTTRDDGDRAVAAEILCGQFRFGSAAASSLIGSLPDVVLIRTAGRPEFLGLQALVTLLRDEAAGFSRGNISPEVAGGARPGASAVVSHLASALFSLILRAWLEQAGEVPGLFALMADSRLSLALHAMLAEPERAWPMEQLALCCHMSRATFVRAFRKVAGMTPGEVLMRLRMAQAAQWLMQPQLGVGQISEAVGYQSEAAFNRAFKRYMGTGPGQYRRSGAAHADGMAADGDGWAHSAH